MIPMKMRKTSKRYSLQRKQSESYAHLHGLNLIQFRQNLTKSEQRSVTEGQEGDRIFLLRKKT